MEPRIVSATISRIPVEVWEPLPKITAKFDDGSVKELFTFYPDEISFLPSEFVGLTEAEALALKQRKDRTYLSRGFHGTDRSGISQSAFGSLTANKAPVAEV